MSFNDGARIDPSKVKRRRRAVGVGAGGGGLVVIALVVISQLTGVDLSGLAPVLGGGTSQGGTTSEESLETCTTGADANASIDCRMVGAATSLSDYWTATAPSLGISGYADPDFFLFDAATDTGCGQATSAVGPFYCPPDVAIYIDTTFYQDLRDKYGASGGPLAEMYVVAHEWGHHIQSYTGALEKAQDGQTGPTSNGVRVELQADCYAGAWAAAASSTDDPSGTPLLEPITDAQVADALSAAAAVGDDRIQGTTANSETWTHGSSESRQKWFTTGFQGGAGACDTFSVATP
ncbi:KPN_02809 family neutral zinc metallopeptidase [Naasia lichenicola]|uniref:Neutral zinc metallopeptidase n=1 Tax=Naasia lichenicola TaxID=2565933 RepID=A0A4S4FI89_9MICO|nr:neutral zinc metallopeptidase [Naasia lichenicola]THG29564.1 neutral zinc metallopeptidase [Naasia lichenicola]